MGRAKMRKNVQLERQKHINETVKTGIAELKKSEGRVIPEKRPLHGQSEQH